jgi:hypothetical protein
MAFLVRGLPTEAPLPGWTTFIRENLILPPSDEIIYPSDTEYRPDLDDTSYSIGCL